MKKKSELKQLLLLVCMMAVAFIFLVPIIWMVSASFQGQGQIFKVPFNWIPREASLKMCIRDRISGIGMGNGFVGAWGSTSAAVKLLCSTPMWFISGVFISGYAVYYLLAKNEEHFLGWILPVITIVFLGSCWMTDTLPLWNVILEIGQFAVNTDLILMFIGLGIGCEIWIAVDALKKKNWTSGGKLALSAVQLCLLYTSYHSV